MLGQKSQPISSFFRSWVDGIEPNGVEWTALEETDILDSEGNRLKTNQYYAQRPELMLGELCDDKLYPGR